MSTKEDYCMRSMFCVIFLITTTVCCADEYVLLDMNILTIDSNKKSEIAQEELYESIEKLQVITEDKEVDTKPQIVDKKDNFSVFNSWKNIYVYLFGTTGIGLTGFLSRMGYLFYQTKKGKIIIKHVKNNAHNISEDIINSIDSLTDIESGEILRSRLKNIQDKL